MIKRKEEVGERASKNVASDSKSAVEFFEREMVFSCVKVAHFEKFEDFRVCGVSTTVGGYSVATDKGGNSASGGVHF